MSFLDKLKTKVEEPDVTVQEQERPQGVVLDAQKDKKTSGFLQLDVDIFQTSSEIIIIAPIPGVEVDDLEISVENENDVVTIQGKREAPALPGENDDEENRYLRQECSWGHFYRQIILPQEVDVANVEAKFRKGILVLTLPLLRLQTKGKKRIPVNA